MVNGPAISPRTRKPQAPSGAALRPDKAKVPKLANLTNNAKEDVLAYMTFPRRKPSVRVAL
jgi:hypothetical protein